MMMSVNPFQLKLTHKVLPIIVLLTLMVSPGYLDDIRSKSIFNITQVAGLSVILPCDLSSFKIYDIKVVLWYRLESDEVVFSFDARKSVPGMPWSHESVWSHRASFQPEGLLLQNIQSTDEGMYRCRVDFTDLPTRNTRVALKVIVPPPTPIIRDRGRTVQSTVGPYLEGETVVLICESLGANPSPTLSWTRGDEELRGELEVQYGVSKNTLRIDNLQRADFKSNLTCWARNNDVTPAAYRTVTVTMNFPPLKTKIIYPTHGILSGKMYHLECVSYGAVPPAKITWWKGNQKLPESSSEIKEDGYVSSSVLSFIPSPGDDGKKIVCKAFSPHIAEKPISAIYNLEVFYPPIVSLKLGDRLNASNVKEGDDIYLNCNIQTKSKVLSVIWKKNGLAIQADRAGGLLISDESLVIQSVHRLHTGYYSCHVTNGEGTGQSEFYLDIKFRPVCRENQIWMYGLGRREEAHVVCSVDSNPPALSFHWIFNNSYQAVDIPQSQAFSDPQRSVLTFVPMTEMDYGILLCWSVNTVGRQKSPCVFRVIPEEAPEPVQNCSLGDQTDSIIQVLCAEGYDGGQPQHFLLEVVDKETQETIRNLTSDISVFYVTGLEAGSFLTLYVYAANSLGRSPAVVIDAATTISPLNQNIKVMFNNEEFRQTESRDEEIFHMTPILATLIVVILSLMIIAVSIVVFVRCRSRRRNNAVTTTVNKGTLAMLSANIMECHEEKKTNMIKCESLNLSDYSESHKYNLSTSYDTPLEIERYTTSPRRVRNCETSHKTHPRLHIIGRNDPVEIRDFSRRSGDVPLLSNCRPDSSVAFKCRSIINPSMIPTPSIHPTAYTDHFLPTDVDSRGDDSTTNLLFGC